MAFRHALTFSEHCRGKLLGVLHFHATWGWAVLPALGLLLGSAVGWATCRFAPAAAGSGIPHLKGVLLHLRLMNWRPLLPVKFLGGVFGIGAGLSLGLEGPTVQMGAAVARAMASLLGAAESDMPQLLSAGAGAGLAAAFNAPLAGLMFVVEELHRELSSRTAAGALVGAVCATIVTQSLGGDLPSFEVKGLSSMPLQLLPLAALIGILAGFGGVLFNKGLLASQSFAMRLRRFPRWSHPGIAGLIVGLTAWWLPDAVGGGHAVAQTVLTGMMNISFLGLIVLLTVKFLMTAISYGSGAPGGIFAPMLLLGALMGTAVAKGAIGMFPSLAILTQTLAVLGMAGFFAGSVRASLTGIVLISEMTGGYELLFPICVASLAAYLTAEMLRDRPIYDALLEADLHRTGHGTQTSEPRTVYLGIQFGSHVAGRRIHLAGFPAGCLVVAVERGGVNMLPNAQMVLLPGDHVSILTPGNQPELPLEIVRLCTGL